MKTKKQQKQCWRTMPWACLVLNIEKRWFRSCLTGFTTLLEYVQWKNNYFIRRVRKIVELSIIVSRYNKIIWVFIVCIQNVMWKCIKNKKKGSNVESEAGSRHSSPTFVSFYAAFIALFKFQACFVLFL